MKLLGHIHVAIESFPQRDHKLLSFGALLPETVFYTKDPALSYEQIHEGGLELYKYCRANQPEFEDLAVGCMTHSYKYGADRFNSLESLIPLGFEKSDISKVAEALMIDPKPAQARVHNLYDLVLDHYIDNKHPEVRKMVELTKDLDKTKISQLLASCYNVRQKRVYNNLTNLWDKYDLDLISSFEGLARFWRSLASDLKEKDPVDIAKTAALLSAYYDRAEPNMEEFIEKVIEHTRSHVTEAINS